MTAATATRHTTASGLAAARPHLFEPWWGGPGAPGHGRGGGERAPLPNAVASMLTVAVTREYGQPATCASAAYAGGILLSLFLYPRAGRWEARDSPWTVMRFGLLGRAAVLTALTALGWARGPWVVWAALGLFAVTQVLWPFLSVSSNTLSVTLSPANRG